MIQQESALELVLWAIIIGVVFLGIIWLACKLVKTNETIRRNGRD